MNDWLPSFCRAETLVLCCGNRFFGDDGFGPAVADHLLANAVPESVCVMDAGTGVRKILCTLALDGGEAAARKIVLVDAVDKGRAPGEIFELKIEEMPPEKLDDFSLHQVPSSNLVCDLLAQGIDIRILVCQVAEIPDHVAPGLSAPVAAAVPALSEDIIRQYFTVVK